MRTLTFQCLIFCLSLIAFNGDAQQQASQPRIPIQSGDDAPIIIGDTSALPFELQGSASASKCVETRLPAQYRYLYSANFQSMPVGKTWQIYDGDTNPLSQHKVTSLYACAWNPRDCMYEPLPGWPADLSGGDVVGFDIWDSSSTHIQLNWTDGNKVTVTPRGHAKPGTILMPKFGLDLDIALGKLRIPGSDAYPKPAGESRYRIVLHYCTGGTCPAGYDPCANGLPSKNEIDSTKINLTAKP